MSYEWIESSVYDCFPENAVWCSKDKTGCDVYIGQYSFEKSVLLVKIIPQKKEAFVAYNGKEIPALSYRVLVNNNNNYQIWKRVFDGNIPKNSVQCGHDSKNRQLLVGRAFHKGYLLPGYVHSKTKVIHIAYKGNEYKYSDFEILINNGQINENNNLLTDLDQFDVMECVVPEINITSPGLNVGSPDFSIFSAQNVKFPNINTESPSLKSVPSKIKRSPRMSPFKVLNRTFIKMKTEPKSPKYDF